MTAARTVSLIKPSPDTKLGIRLSGSRGQRVKVVDVSRDGPLSTLIFKGEILQSINGVPCSDGHQVAAEMLKGAQSLIIEVGPRRPSIAERITGKRPHTPQSSSVLTEPALADSAFATESVMPLESPYMPASARGTTNVAPGKTANAGRSPKFYDESELGPGEFTVVLQRNNTASIGMRLVQKKHTDLPNVADIDPHGPAAKTSIEPGDILLAVNGVDARSTHDELKKALGMTDAAILKLRRGSTKTDPKSGSEKGPKGMAPAPGKSGGLFFFPCCTSRGPAAAANGA